jgi:hypothetical protein
MVSGGDENLPCQLDRSNERSTADVDRFLLTRTVTGFHSSVKTARAFLAQHKLRFTGFGEV